MNDEDNITVVMTIKQAKEIFGDGIIDKARNQWEKSERVLNDSLPREMQKWR